MDNSYKLEAID